MYSVQKQGIKLQLSSRKKSIIEESSEFAIAIMDKQDFQLKYFLNIAI